ncbi:MAG: hypothetical protein WCP55_03655, partial [Lentisphaerota bacterium]
MELFFHIEISAVHEYSNTEKDFDWIVIVSMPFRVYHFLIFNHGDRLKPYLLYAFLRNFIEKASVFDFEPVFVYNLKGCQ